MEASLYFTLKRTHWEFPYNYVLTKLFHKSSISGYTKSIKPKIKEKVNELEEA